MSQNNTQQTQSDNPKHAQRRKVENIEEIKESERTKLNRAYTIWAHMKQPKFIQNTYDQVLKPAASFSTVEDFWAVYSHFKRPSLMSFGTTLYLFQEGIKPMWEDDQCKNGGRWMLKMPKTHTNKYWEDITLALIGEQFTHDNEIVGIQLALKPVQDVLSIWIRHGKDEEKVQQVKSDIERIIMLDESNNMKLDYEDFQEVLSRPPPEKKEGAFNRNIKQAQNQDNQEQPAAAGGDDADFERNQLNRGGGFTKGRGRGRGGFRGGQQQQQ